MKNFWNSLAACALAPCLAVAGCSEPTHRSTAPAESSTEPTTQVPAATEAEVKRKSEAEAKRERQIEAAAARERQIEAVRQSDPALNWVNVGISTGKFSESLHGSVHKTFDECAKSSWMEDNECVPIPALPESYWNAGKNVGRSTTDQAAAE